MTTNQTTLTAEETDWLEAYEAHVAHMHVEAASRGWNAEESRRTSDRRHELRRLYEERHGEPTLPQDCTVPDSRERASQLWAKKGRAV